MLSTYVNYQLYARDPAKAYQRAAALPMNARDAEYYRDNIGKITNVDDFMKDYRLFSYAMKAFSLDDMTYAKAFMKKVLTSDLSDEASFANKLTDTRYKAFAEAFQFDSEGKVVSTAAIQSAEQASDTIDKFQAATASNPIASLTEAAYLHNTLPTIASLDGLMENQRLLSDVLIAYGVDPSTDAETIAAALKSDFSDPTSLVNQDGNEGLKEMVSDFNFDADGKIATERLAQTKDSFSRMAKLYSQVKVTDDASKTAATDETSYVWNVISTATSIDTVLNDSRVVAYVGTAFGDAKLDATKLRAVLTSDLEDPKSVANSLGPKYHDIAASFQFTTKGTIARDLNQTAQSKTDIEFTTQNFLQMSMETEAGDSNVGTKLALYFARKAPGLTSAYELLGDKALLKFVQTAFQLPEQAGTNVDSMAKAIEKKLDMKDLKDPEKLNKLIVRFAALYDMNNGNNPQSYVLQLFGAGSSDTASTGTVGLTL